jgi:hypothetical protein
MEEVLEKGTSVVFSQRSGNDRIDPSVHVIESSELLEGRIFYRLRGLTGALFVRESLTPSATLKVPPPQSKGKRSCNRHSDCDEAEAKVLAANPGNQISASFHCHDDECEDCFGC